MEFASLLTNLHLQRNRYKESNVVILYRSNVIFTNFPQKTFRKTSLKNYAVKMGVVHFLDVFLPARIDTRERDVKPTKKG